MGQLFTQPNSALSTPGGPTFVGNPHQVLGAANAGLPSADAMLGPDVLNPNTQAPKLPFIGRPSVQQAAETGAQPGGANALSPGLSKLGKLATLLTSGVQGALAGHAAQEQAIIQSGGRRAGGAGIGFEAGVSYPQQRAQQQAETTVAQAGARPFEAQGADGQLEKPFGNLPAALSQKFISPYLGYQGKVATNTSRENIANAQVAGRQNVANTAAQSREDVAQIAHRFTPVQGVGLFDNQSRQLVPGTQQGITVTPEIASDYGLPQDFIGKPMKLSEFSSVERAGAQYQPTVRTSTDPLGLTTTSTSQKQRPGTQSGAVSGGVVNKIPGSNGVPVQSQAPTPRGRVGRTGAPAQGAPTSASSPLDSMAQRLVDGDADPSQVSKRSSSNLMVMDKANQYSMQKYGKPFDQAQAQADYEYAKAPATQNTLKMINGMTEKGGAIEIASKAAENLPQLDSQTLNKVFNAASTEFGDSNVSNFHTAMLGLADEYSKVMGGGTGSDTGRQQGLDLLKAAYSKGQLGGAVEIMKQDINARKMALIGENRYLQKQYGNKGQSGQNGPRRTIVF